jgi:hypothetical protein
MLRTFYLRSITSSESFSHLVAEASVMSHGSIKEHGTYAGLMQANGDAARLFREFGQTESADGEGDQDSKRDGKSPLGPESGQKDKSDGRGKAAGTGKIEVSRTSSNR